MKKLDTSPISSTAGMPGKAGVLNHLQQSYQEILAAIVNNIIGAQYDPTIVYVLYGCANTGSGLSYVISAGAVFFNGEVYLVDATSFVAISGQVAISNIATTFATSAIGDPIQFTDGSSHSVLQIVKVVLSADASGAGALPDYSNWVLVNAAAMQTLIIAAFGSSYTIPFTQDQAIFFTAGLTAGAGTLNWDFTDAVQGTVVRLKIVAASGTTFTVSTPGGSTIINESGSFTAAKTNIFYIVYLGVNDLGNHEVSYKVISL